MTNQELKEKLKQLEDDIKEIEERNKLKKQISKAKDRKFLLKLGLNFKNEKEN